MNVSVASDGYTYITKIKEIEGYYLGFLADGQILIELYDGKIVIANNCQFIDI